MKLEDLNIYDVGVNIQIAGALWADGETVYIIPLPNALTEAQHQGLKVATELNGDAYVEDAELVGLDMNLAEWQRFIRQTDLLEVEVLAAHDPDETGKVPKILLRKSARQISQGVSWAVFKRDGYRCRYCGIQGGDNGAVLTVDHVVTWEEGGPSIEENLVTACRRCNKVRGNKSYRDWLRHPYYKDKSRNLIMAAADANQALLHTIDDIPRMVHKPSKR